MQTNQLGLEVLALRSRFRVRWYGMVCLRSRSNGDVSVKLIVQASDGHAKETRQG